MHRAYTSNPGWQISRHLFGKGSQEKEHREQEKQFVGRLAVAAILNEVYERELGQAGALAETGSIFDPARIL